MDHHEYESKTSINSSPQDLVAGESQECHHQQPDKLVASFSMLHVLVWIIVGVMDRYALP